MSWILSVGIFSLSVVDTFVPNCNTRWRFPGGTSGEENCLLMQELQRCGFDLPVRETLWRRAWQPPPVFLPGESHGQRSLEGYKSMESQRAGHD